MHHGTVAWSILMMNEHFWYEKLSTFRPVFDYVSGLFVTIREEAASRRQLQRTHLKGKTENLRENGLKDGQN